MCSPGSGSGSRFRFGYGSTYLIESGSNPNPDPKHDSRITFWGCEHCLGQPGGSHWPEPASDQSEIIKEINLNRRKRYRYAVSKVNFHHCVQMQSQQIILVSVCTHCTVPRRCRIFAIRCQSLFCTGTGGAVCKGATPSVEQPGGRGFKPRLRSFFDKEISTYSSPL